MLKYVMLCGAMAVAAPAAAQGSSMNPQEPTANPAPAGRTANIAPAPAMSSGAATAADGNASQDDRKSARRADGLAPAGQPGDPASTDPAQPAAGDQVATIVNAEFATYDRDGDGALDKVEFAEWMDALKAKAPNAVSQPGDPAWNAAAFAQADEDRSATVSRAELTRFLGGPTRAGAM